MTFMSLFVACTDDDDDASGTDSGFTEEVVVVNPACDDYTYQLKTDKQWKAEIADQWASLYVASGKGSSELKFFTEENGDDESRNTTLLVTFDDGTEKKVTIKQKGLAESGSNALGDGIYQKHGVCYGYNGYGKYADASSICGQIVNEKMAIALLDSLYPGLLSIATENFQTIENIESSGSSAQDMSQSLSVNAGLSLDLPCGFAMDIKANYDSKDLANSSKNFSKRRHKMIVLQKIMSVQNLTGALWEHPEFENKILTVGFRRAISTLKKSISGGNDAAANQAIIKFVKNYGTHIIMSAQLGGCFDYCMTTDKSNVSSSTDISAGLNMGYQKMFSIQGDASFNKMNNKIGSNYSCSVTVMGGDAGILSAATNGQEGANNSDDIQKWEASINHENSLMIDHTLMPIWEIISDEEVADAVEQYLTTGKYVKANPTYELPEPVSDVTGAIKVALSDFKEDVVSMNQTLVYTINAAGSPVAEICHELIPAISTQSRVFVAYSIVEGKPNYDKGYFIGDGVRKPGKIEWNEEKKSYIYTADTDIEVGLTADTLYILGKDGKYDFAISPDKTVKTWSIGFMCPSHAKFYRVESSNNNNTTLAYYNIVKIGKQVWMRENLQTPIGLGYKKFPCVAVDGNYFYGWGDNGDHFLQTQWSIPSSESFKEMQAIAQTGAPFLKGGSTGFDLEVLGYYDYNKGKYYNIFKWTWIEYDHSTQKELETYILRTLDDKIICIDKDGLEPMREEAADTKMYYPVRFVRSADFKYE